MTDADLIAELRRVCTTADPVPPALTAAVALLVPDRDPDREVPDGERRDA